MAVEVANAIVTNIEERCQCGFTRSNITSDGFRCFPGSTDAVTYHGEIHETDTANDSCCEEWQDIIQATGHQEQVNKGK